MKTTASPNIISSALAQLVTNATDVQNRTSPHTCSIEESYKYVTLPLCYSLTFLLSIILNSTVLLRSYRCRGGHQWNTSLIYMVNLASTDLMYSFSLPFLVASYVMRDHWVFGDFMCRLVRFLFYFNLYCSIFFLTCISVHRYMGICHPIRSITLESKRAVRGICTAVWVVVFILTCPIVRFAKTGDVTRKLVDGVNEGVELWSAGSVNAGKVEVYRNCWDDAIDSEFSEYVPYGIVLHVLGFFFPFIVIAWCYSQVVRTIFQTLHSQPRTQEEGGMCSGTEGVKDRTSVSISGCQHAPYISRRRKSIKTIITITFLFALCFLPFHITRTLFLILKETKAAECQTMKMVSICYKITRPLASCNSWLNALLYFVTGDKSLACCGRTSTAHNTHLLWPLQILGGQKEADQEHQNQNKADEGHESDSKSSGMT
ncbi:P2Y purinoceptor 3 [Triplophysa rosa]|uniref:P2Y purinoceptor 3-like n=1 Tax=Triplophysa rosa TaxID=992332 RepID=A0A9W7WBV3_TRIRA|nr:P2Y purinoceptor 3 [Triplophysa rosa]KAI7793159.1 putative P2Y purinoceptor 3-like [Triplophysa rosa]